MSSNPGTWVTFIDLMGSNFIELVVTRIARIDIEDNRYHVIVRGINRQKLFLED